MTADDVSALVRRALAELVTPPPRRALVLFTGALVGFERVIGELDLLAASGVELEYVQTPSAERILDQRLIASVPMRPADRHLTGSHDTLVVATLTQNAAAKTAHGIADCLASNLLNDYLLAGRPVVAAASGCDPDDPDKRRWFPTIPEGLAAVMRENLETLRGFGVRTARAGALARTVLAAYERAERARTAPLTTALGMSRRELLDRLGAPAPATPVAVGGRPGPLRPRRPGREPSASSCGSSASASSSACRSARCCGSPPARRSRRWPRTSPAPVPSRSSGRPEMFLATVRGTVVSTSKDERLVGFKLLLVQPLDVDGGPTGRPEIAVDTVGAGIGATVIVTKGSSARFAASRKESPIDSTVVGIVDSVELAGD